MTTSSMESESYAPLSPFTEMFDFAEQSEAFGAAAENTESSSSAGGFEFFTELESPFRSAYDEVGSESSDIHREAYDEAVSSLYESEFSEALYELAAEASSSMSEQIGEASANEAERYLENYMTPVAREAESFLERYAEQYAQHDISQITEQELDRLFETIQPSFEHLTPGVENFLGGLWKKAKAVAGGAIRLAKKGIAAVGKVIPLGFILKGLKKIVRPLLKRVLDLALSRLPVSLRPAARKVATKLFGVGETEGELESYFGGSGEQEAVSTELQALAHTDVDSIQHEIDAKLVGELFAESSENSEAWMSGESATAESETDHRLAELDAARERFINEISQATNEASINAAMENFIPAIIAALRLGISIIGRDRVVGFLAKYLATLVRPYIGPTIATQLSQAIVSTGMSMIGLEVPGNQTQLAAEAVASAVEGTVQRLTELESDTFEDQHLLEAVVQEAFAEAASESFPSNVIREQYQEVSTRLRHRGTWILRPRNGRKRYRFYSRPLDVTVTHQLAKSVTGFGGIHLGTFLKSRYGVTGPVACKAYLFEAMVGTKLSTIARLETHVPGLGPTHPRGWRLFIPLTRHNATALFGEPGLGRDVPNHYLHSHRRIAVRQRFVVLVPQRTPTTAHPTSPGTTAHPVQMRGHASQVNITLDFPTSTARLCIHLDESDAQAVAASIRRGESVTPALILLRRVYVAGVKSVLSGNASRHVKIVHEVASEEQFVGGALSAIGAKILEKLADKVIEWIGTAVSEYLQRRRQEFLTAADKPAQGVTIVVAIRHAGAMKLLDDALRGKGLGSITAVARAILGSPEVTVRSVAGFQS
ncbi:hypothetical protein [Mycobacterium sp. 852013-50091_SCH5140682]|uniref:hypothetical protein n=1 Tax=Mycobacterium sp. 852013-50091_SCH5140682 TaxID=1834109 RepID=UPI000A639279|nr:hypothetical protein [Mycobacterium sp. 852013-50091_SCH5140682]